MARTSSTTNKAREIWVAITAILAIVVIVAFILLFDSNLLNVFVQSHPTNSSISGYKGFLGQFTGTDIALIGIVIIVIAITGIFLAIRFIRSREEAGDS